MSKLTGLMRAPRGGERAYFLVLTVSSAIAIAFPFSILVGLLLGGIPGLLLLIAPNLLAYSIVGYVLRGALRFICDRAGIERDRLARRRAIDASAVGLVVLAAFITPIMISSASDHASAVARARDREPMGVVVLPETVALISSDKTFAGGGPLGCGTLCLRLLYNGATKRVLVLNASSNTRRAFKIERRETCPALSGSRWPDVDIRFPGDARGSIEKIVRARIAQGECLIAEPAALDEAVGLTLKLDDPCRTEGIYLAEGVSADGLSTRTLEVIGMAGDIGFRRTEVMRSPPVTPLLFVQSMTLFSPAGSEHVKAGLLRRDVVENSLGPAARNVLPVWFGNAVRLPDAK